MVHFTVPEGAPSPRPGDFATVRVSYAAPHHLVADQVDAESVYAVRTSPAGDAWDRRQAASCAPAIDSASAEAGPRRPVVLGVPALRRP